MHPAKRIFLIGLVVALAVSYAGPIRGYRAKRAELRSQEIALKSMVRQRDAMRAQLGKMSNPEVIEARARQLGYIRPGEVQYRITGLDDERPPARAAARKDPGFWSWLPAVF